MTFDEYQKRAHETSLPSCRNANYLIPGLAAEVGEICGKWAKSVRGDKVFDFDDLCKELGDVLWFVSELLTLSNHSLGATAHLNIEKLQDRKNRGKIQGDGDLR